MLFTSAFAKDPKRVNEEVKAFFKNSQTKSVRTKAIVIIAVIYLAVLNHSGSKEHVATF